MERKDRLEFDVEDVKMPEGKAINLNLKTEKGKKTQNRKLVEKPNPPKKAVKKPEKNELDLSSAKTVNHTEEKVVKKPVQQEVKESKVRTSLGSDFKMSKLLFFIVTVYITTLIVSNTIGSKIISVFSLDLAASVIVFPIIYVIADLLTEVYGFKFARFVIWVGFAINLYVVIIYMIVANIPFSSVMNPTDGAAYATVFGSTFRILFASFVSYLAGSYANAKSMSVLKVKLNGEKLWVRTIGSTIIGEAIDTFLFITIAFTGIVGFWALMGLVITQYIIKVIYEICCTPIIYWATERVKESEGIDVYDDNELEFDER